MKRLIFLFSRTSRTDLRLLWFALRHPHRPGWLLPAALGLLVYALAPFNFVLPVLGVVDDLVLVPMALHWLLKMLPPQIAAARAMQR